MAKWKDAPSSVLTRSGRKTSTGIQDSTNPLNTRKSPRFEKQMAPTPSTVKKKPEKSEKQMGLTPLRMSERGKNPVDVQASNAKSTEKSVDISEDITEEGSRNSNGGGKKRKRYHAVEFKARKSPRFQKQMGPTPSTKPEISEKQMGSTPLRRSERGTNPVDVPASKVKSAEKSSDISEESAEDGSRVSDGGSKKGKGYHAVEFKARYKPQQERVGTEGSEVLAHTESRSSSGTLAANETADGNANSLYQHQPTVSELCNILKFSEGARMSPAVPLNPQKQKRENHGSSNEEALQSGGQILEEGIARKERNEWNKKKKTILNDFILEKSLISYLYDSNSSKRSEKLNLAVKDFAEKLNEHERSRQVYFNEAMPKAAHGTQIVDLMESGNEDQESREVAPDLLGNPLEAESHDKPMHGMINQETEQDTTPSVQQVASPVSDHSMPAIPEIHNDSHLLQQPSEDGIQDQEGQVDPTPMVEIDDDNMQRVESIQVDSSLNPHDEPSSVMSANPMITENQAAMLPTSEVLAQTTASLVEQHMFDLQRNANSNQVGSQMPHRVDPLQNELEQLSSVREKMVKPYHNNIQKINIDCEKEIADAIAEIRLKYHNRRQEADAAFNSQMQEVENNMNTVVINQVLAATFRQKLHDVSRGCGATQQACQAESMQLLHRLRGPSTCLPGEFSGTQQPQPIAATAVARPPQQVRQPSALFLTRLTRHPHTTNLRPANTTPIRPPPNTETCSQSPQSRPLVSSVTRSLAPHMRVLVSREIQIPGPHMRPLASSGARSSTSPMRPSNPASSSGHPHFGTYHRTLSVQHVTSSVPLTSPSNSQPLNLTSSVQPLPPLPWKRFPVPQPRSESPHASVARALSILKMPEFPGWGNAAQPPSAHELVYLSDDE